MSYHLRRTSDGAGDSGMYSVALAWNEDKTFKGVDGDTPKVGCSMQVGSDNASTYRDQDYWTTTVITEILEEIKNDAGHYIKFRTMNSVYEWSVGDRPERIKKLNE